MVLMEMQILKCTIFLFTQVLSLRIVQAQDLKSLSDKERCKGKCCIGFFRWQGHYIECPLGKYGYGCMDNCPSNRYGQLCGERCNCEEGYFCSSIYGCVPPPVDGCPEGKRGPKCQDNCEPEHYGVNCSMTCTCNEEQYCNSEKGCRNVIEARCPTGYYGPNCNLTCPQDRYGTDCSFTCMCETNQRCHIEHGCQNLTTTSKQRTTGEIGNCLKENIKSVVSGLVGLVIGIAVVPVLLYTKRRCVCTGRLRRHQIRDTQPVRVFFQETYNVNPTENLAESVSENVAISDIDGIYPLGMHYPQRQINLHEKYQRNSEVECQDDDLMDSPVGGSYTERIYDEPIRGDFESCRLASSREQGYSNDVVAGILKEPDYSNECWLLQMRDGTNYEVKEFLYYDEYI